VSLLPVNEVFKTFVLPFNLFFVFFMRKVMSFADAFMF